MTINYTRYKINNGVVHIILNIVKIIFIINQSYTYLILHEVLIAYLVFFIILIWEKRKVLRKFSLHGKKQPRVV